jgi:Helix-turn-helix domain
MPWKESSVVDERMRFVIQLKDGESMASLCREFGISRKTGYKIFERYEECGLEGLTDRTRRRSAMPTSCPSRWKRRSSPPGARNPTGAPARSAERLLQRLPHAVKVPASSTIHGVLDRHGLVSRMTRLRTRAEGTPLSDGLNPNDLWSTDYKGGSISGPKMLSGGWSTVTCQYSGERRTRRISLVFAAAF